MGQNTGNQIPSTENPGVHTGGGAFFGNAKFTGGGHAFGSNGVVNNTQDHSTRNIHDNRNNKGVIGDGNNNIVNSGNNSGNTDHTGTLQENASEGQRNDGDVQKFVAGWLYSWFEKIIRAAARFLLPWLLLA